MKNYQSELMSRNGLVVMLFAEELLTCSVGDRINTIEQYSQAFKVGRGTVQSALKFIQDIEAVKLESKGHMGTYIAYIDYVKLWKVSGIVSVTGVMPLPYSKRYEGLATGLYMAFEKAGIPFNLAFMRGASKRIEALSTGKYNFAIVSKLAALQHIKEYSNIEIIHEFSPGSYVGERVVIFRDKNEIEIRNGMRVALDPISADQVILTYNECRGKEVKFVETSYTQILQKLINNEIDVAIWNGDEMKDKNLQFGIHPLKNTGESDDMVATFVVSKDSMHLNNALQKFIDMKEIELVQNKVLIKEIIPMY